MSGLDLDTQRRDVLDITVHHIVGATIRGDGGTQHAAGLAFGLKYCDLVTFARQIERSTQARRAGAYHGNPCCQLVLNRTVFGFRMLSIVVVGHEALDATDLNRSFFVAPRAVGFARRITRPRQAADQWCVFQMQVERLFEAPRPDQRDITAGLDVARTSESAGGFATPVNHRLFGDGLRERNMCHPARHQTVVVLIGYRDRADFLALATTGTGIKVDVGGLFVQVHSE